MKKICCLPLLMALFEVHATETLRVSNWQNYIAPEVLTSFEQKTGAKVEYRTLNTAEHVEQALTSTVPFDVVAPSHFQLLRMIQEGKLQRLDHSRINHYEQVDSGLLAMLAGINGANLYAVPYMWGSIGLVINPEIAEAHYGGPLQNSWGVLFDETQSSRLAGCGLGLLDAPEEIASLWSTYRGRNLALMGPHQITRSMQQLAGLLPRLRSFDNENYISALSDGQLCASMAWVGHALVAAEKNPGLRYIIPDEGSVVFIDTLAIPSNARNPELAYRFINHLLDPANALASAKTSNFYPSLRNDSRELATLAIERPMQVLQTEERRRLYTLERLNPEQTKALDASWKKLKALRPSQ